MAKNLAKCYTHNSTCGKATDRIEHGINANRVRKEYQLGIERGAVSEAPRNKRLQSPSSSPICLSF